MATEVARMNGERAMDGAYVQLWNHTFSYMKSMSLKCAVELGIPDIVHNHGRPITLSALVAAIPVPVLETDRLRRLMRLLVHTGLFSISTHQKTGAIQKEEAKEEELYALTPLSRLLVGDSDEGLSSFVILLLDSPLLNPWHFVSRWLETGETKTSSMSTTTPFEICHGFKLWEYAEKNPEFNRVFNQGMVCYNHLWMRKLVTENTTVFDGFKSLVDVGGVTGGAAEALAEAFPHLKITVLDLPHVNSGLQVADSGVDFVSGNMIRWIPPADAVLLKSILHNWSDEECAQILRKCKEAIPSREMGGKVIFMDLVVNSKRGDDDHTVTETQFFLDLQMTVLQDGK